LSLRTKTNGVKRTQILEGAHAIFMERGYDATSMNEVARTAGVSKGTLYGYFPDKDALFGAIIERQCSGHELSLVTFDPDKNVETTLHAIGQAYVGLLCRPNGGSTVRIVMAIAERMPEVGRRYYRNFTGAWSQRTSAFLKTQAAKGVLTIGNCDLAASQFLLTCQAPLFTPFIFQASAAPSPSQVQAAVQSATHVFLAAYRVAGANR
jgi:AcrR family transcriptional regulator